MRHDLPGQIGADARNKGGRNVWEIRSRLNRLTWGVRGNRKLQPILQEVTTVGLAPMHKDSKGFNVLLTAIPVSRTVVAREPRAPDHN